ncbi:MAG: alpha-amylase family protein [Dermatophilaceae bacterium]
MSRVRRRWVVVLLALAVALLSRCVVAVQSPAPTATPEPAPTASVLAPAAPRDVVVTLFQWDWRSVAAECPHLAQVGYAGVQVSPATEHAMVTGNPWYVDYQPVSYRLDTRRGDRAAYQQMVTACHAAGVRVYADVVVNHMAGSDGGVGYAGSPWTHYDYPGIYGPTDFHHCGLTPGDEIRDYQDRTQVQTCELVNLADLATDTEPVRARLAAYLTDLVSLGVDGFRVDAAKHIPAADLADVLRRVPGTPDAYAEVIDYGGEPIRMAEYTPFVKVLVFTYGDTVGGAVQGARLSDLRALGGAVEGTRARVFLDNHDTQRHGGPQVLTHRSPAAYRLGNVYMLAWPYGEPTVMSSYAFTDPDAGPPALDDRGTTKDSVCGSDGWVCEHRWPAVEGMVGFHNTVKGTGVDLWWDDGGAAVGFARGERGFVVLNSGGAALTGRSFQTRMPPGRYCDVVHGAPAAGGCAGPTVTVNADGWFTADVGAVDALAIHVGARVG